MATTLMPVTYSQVGLSCTRNLCKFIGQDSWLRVTSITSRNTRSLLLGVAAWVILREMTVTFLQISDKPQLHSPEPDYFFGRPMNRRFQWYIVHIEIQSTFHARGEYMRHSNQWTKKRKTSRSPKWGTWTPSNSLHPSINWPHSPLQTASRSN